MTQLPASDQTIAARRRTLREKAIAERLALSAEARERLTQALQTHLDALMARLAPQRLAFCWPFRGEPDLRAWVERWLDADPDARTALLPVVLGAGTPLVFRRWVPGQDMPVDRHGIPHPAEGEALVPDVVLIPCNAFDAAGYRLGYGGGYFDRTLATIDTTAVGLGYEFGRADTVHPQPHDCPMQWVVTEQGAFPAQAA